MSRLFLFLIPLLLTACNSNQSDKGVTPKNDTTQYINDHDTLGESHARKQLQELLQGKSQPFTWDTLITSSQTAIAMVEPLLFNIFGKEQILSEKPYEAYLIEGYWYISGTIPKNSKGGGFEIILSATNAEVIRLTHYK